MNNNKKQMNSVNNYGRTISPKISSSNVNQTVKPTKQSNFQSAGSSIPSGIQNSGMGPGTNLG